MKFAAIAAGAAALVLAHAPLRAGGIDPLTAPIQIAAAEKWNHPEPATRIFGNTYYVGVAGLSSILIDSGDGLILLDGDLPQSVPLIEANIVQLGFRVRDIKFILNSHAHFDHAGGIAALARDSGAQVVASPSGAAALRAGRAVADDPQAGYAAAGRVDPALFPKVESKIREVQDGETLRLGRISVSAHLTPGHTPGSTTWSWRDCVERRCLAIVYADSLNAISAPGFHFLADTTHDDLTIGFRRSIQRVAELPCDILLTVHPDLIDMPRKLAQLRAGAATNPLVDAQGCRNYARNAQQLLDARIRAEREASPAR